MSDTDLFDDDGSDESDEIYCPNSEDEDEMEEVDKGKGKQRLLGAHASSFYGKRKMESHPVLENRQKEQQHLVQQKRFKTSGIKVYPWEGRPHPF